MGGGEVMRVSQKRHAQRSVNKLHRKIKALKGELLMVKASVGREKARIRASVQPVLESMRETETALRKALAQATELGPNELLRLDDVIHDAGFWRRLWFGLQFAFTGRIV